MRLMKKKLALSAFSFLTEININEIIVLSYGDTTKNKRDSFIGVVCQLGVSGVYIGKSQVSMKEKY